MKNRTKKVVVNFFYQSLFQVLTITFPMITIPIVSHNLGVEQIGMWSFTNSIVGYVLVLAALGRASYATREIAYVRENKEDLSKKFWELQYFNMIFSLSIFLIYIIIILLTNQSYLFLIQSLMILGVVFDISWFFQGIEEFKKIALKRTVIKIFSLFCIIMFINSPADLWIYALILSGSKLISALVLWKLLFGYVVYIKVSIKSIWSHLKPALSFFILKISATIFVNINTTILGIVSTVVSVGYFTNSLKLIVILGTIMNSINQVLLPRMSNLQKKGHEGKLIATLQKTIHFQLFCTIAMMFGIIAINQNLIDWLLGEEFYYVKNLVPLLAPILVFQQLHQGIADQFLVPRNEMKLYNLTMIIGTFLNVIICIALIPIIEVYGAVLGFLLGQIFLAVSRAIILILKSTFKFHWVAIVKWLLSGLLMLATIRITTNGMGSTALTTFVQIVLGFITYMGLTFILKENLIYRFIKIK